ncbi:transposase, partial [Escherichia coli]|uniref:transposase n=1 Tax=Escherichia coli TaxID=562 RepID=UPI001E46AD32
HTDCPLTDFRGKTSIFSHPVYLFLRKFSLQDSRGGSKSSLMLYEQFGDLKFKYRNREFWCRGYYVDTVGKNTAKIQDYIKHQLEEDKMEEQLSIPYPGSPFTGRK